jgi:hypothetical protein
MSFQKLPADLYPPDTPSEALPFVKAVDLGLRDKLGRKLHRTRRDCWAVEPTNDYGLACERGAEYAPHFLLYLLHNRDVGFLLSDVVLAMGKSDAPNRDDMRGYAIGFFSFIDRGIHHSVMPSHSPFERTVDWQLRANEARSALATQEQRA